MKKIKVLLIQEVITHYRVEIFNRLSELVDLTVVYVKGNIPDDLKCKTLYNPYYKLRYKFYKYNMRKIARQYDVVICPFDFSYMFSRLVDIFPRKFKLIRWGIGVAASYDVSYDSCEKTVKKFCKKIKKADAAVFYSNYPISKYKKMGVSDKKLYVANNTVIVEKLDSIKEKDSILFVGTLYKQKGVDILINSYLNAYNKNSDIPKLVIVGDGEEKDNIKKLISDNKLDDKIILTGAIFDEKVLCEYFSKAIICVSPNQAGLTVLKSMGYGVPYVTHEKAITGGEIFNIVDGENGFIIKDWQELDEIILSCTNNKSKFLEMGAKAQEYYNTHCTPENMVKGFVDAINYAIYGDV